MPQTLLLADDSVTIQRVIELTFADEDIRVVAVSDGDEAIKRIEAEPPDIVLVDIGMPGRTGYEVAHHIKQSPQLQHIPVLLLTGAFEPVDQAKATAAGCNGVLAKPFEPQLVIARVKELLGKEGRGAPAMDAVAEKPLPKAPVSDLWAPAPAAAESATDSWGLGSAQPAAEPRPPEVAHLDRYFADLDAAFANLDTGPADQTKSDSMLSPIANDWFHMIPEAPPVASPDLPLSVGETVGQPEPAPQLDLAPQDEPARHTDPAPKVAPVAPQTPAPDVKGVPVALPPLADAFAAILAAEQHDPIPALGDLWPAFSPPPAPAPASASGGASLSEAAIEQITRRVLDRLSDQVVRDTVADLVTPIAERLVREEIERIKSTIK